MQGLHDNKNTYTVMLNKEQTQKSRWAAAATVPETHLHVGTCGAMDTAGGAFGNGT